MSLFKWIGEKIRSVFTFVAVTIRNGIILASDVLIAISKVNVKTNVSIAPPNEVYAEQEVDNAPFNESLDDSDTIVSINESRLSEVDMHTSNTTTHTFNSEDGQTLSTQTDGQVPTYPNRIGMTRTNRQLRRTNNNIPLGKPIAYF